MLRTAEETEQNVGYTKVSNVTIAQRRLYLRQRREIRVSRDLPSTTRRVVVSGNHPASVSRSCERALSHRGSKCFNNRLTLLRWARILSFANAIRRTTHRHPGLFFDIRNPRSSRNEPRVPTDTKLYFFVE